MSQYSSMTVVQLKDVLKERGLSVEGKKADLVARLTENDSGAHLGGELDDDDAAAPVHTEEVAEGNGAAKDGAVADSKPQPTDANAAQDPVAAQDSAATQDSEGAVGSTLEAAKPKILSAEERKQLAVEHLTKKLKRAEKFGDEALAAAAKKDLARVDKFGVDIGTALAKEIGLLDRSVNSELSLRRPHRKSAKHNKVHK